MKKCSENVDYECADANLFFLLDEEYWHKGIMTAILSCFLAKMANRHKKKRRYNISVITNSNNMYARYLMSKFLTINE